MRTKKFIKLINNERRKFKVSSTKACAENSTDNCFFEDHADCVVNSYDVCDKDHAACFNNSYDYCDTYRDTDLCSDGSHDYN